MKHKSYGVKSIFFGILLQIMLTYSAIAQNCTINAGIPQTVCANASLTLQGQASGLYPGGTPSLSWSQVSGPNTAVISSPNTLNTGVTGLMAGTYVFKLSTVCADNSAISNNVTVTVRPIVIANAGVNATYCPGFRPLFGNNPSPGTGTWSIVGGTNANLAGLTVSNPSFNSSSVQLPTNRSGSTTLRWTISQTTSGTTCTSFSDVVITNRGGVSNVTAGNDTTLSACYSGTQSLTLNGSFAGSGIDGQQGTWTQVSGPNTVTGLPSNNNAQAVSNLVTGVYRFRWTVSGPCANGTADVVVTVPPSAGTLTGNVSAGGAQSFCDGRTSTILAGTRPVFTGEVGVWTLTAGSGTIANANNYQTAVTGLGTGVNTFTWTITNAAGCSASATVNVTVQPAPTVALSTPSPLILACNASSATINYTTTGGTNTVYQLLSGPAGFTPQASPFNGGATSQSFFNLNIPGNYVIRISRVGASGCTTASADVVVVRSATGVAANAGTDQLLACNVTATALAGNQPTPGVARGFWSQVSGPNMATIANDTLYNTGISNLIPGAYVFKWIVNSGTACVPSESMVTVRVAATAPQQADAGTNRTVCHSTPVQLSGNTPALNEIGTWTVTPNTGVVFSNVNDPRAIVTGLQANTAYIFTWTLANGCGSTAATVNMLTNATAGAATASAGADQCLGSSQTSTALFGNTASPSGATGTWSLISGPNNPSLGNPSAASTALSGLIQGTYAFRWAISVAGCSVSADTVLITVPPVLTVSAAGASQTFCSDAVPGAVSLSANAATSGVGTWSQIAGPGGAIISDSSQNNTTVNGLRDGLYRFRWTIASGVCSNSSTTDVIISTPPSAAVVSADSLCLARTQLAALAATQPAYGVGSWSQLSGPVTATIATPSSPTSSLSNLVSGSYKFRWTVVGGPGCASKSADMNVSVSIAMPASLVTSSVCQLASTSLTGPSGVSGIWSQVSGPSIATITPAPFNVAQLSALDYGSYVFQFTPTAVPGCTAQPSRTMTLNNGSGIGQQPIASPDQSLCNANSFTLTANAPSSQGTNRVWSWVSGPNNPATSALTASTLTVGGGSPAVTYGNYVYRLTFNGGGSNAGCSFNDDVAVFNSQPTTPANAGANQTICSSAGQASLSANMPTIGIGSWSQVSGPASSITDAAASATTANGLNNAGAYTYLWKIMNGACSSQAQTTVNVDAAPVADAGPDQNICAPSATLQATAPVAGSGLWTQVSGPAANIAAPTQYNTQVTGLTQGNTYVFRWTVSNGVCPPDQKTASLLVCNSPLPLTLISFTGHRLSDRNRLQWTTADEVNVAHFAIERSVDGMRFDSIGIRLARNGATQNYQYDDILPATRLYYRIRMVDIDGRKKFSPIISLGANQLSSGSMTVFPNPSVGSLKIQISSSRNAEAQIAIIDALGRCIYMLKTLVVRGEQIIPIQLPNNIATGQYTIQISDNGEFIGRSKVIVVK